MWVCSTHDGEHLSQLLGGIRNHCRSDAVTTGGNASISVSSAEDFEVGDWIHKADKAGIRSNIGTKNEPKLPMSNHFFGE